MLTDAGESKINNTNSIYLQPLRLVFEEIEQGVINKCNPEIHVGYCKCLLYARKVSNDMFTYKCCTKQKKYTSWCKKIITWQPNLNGQLWNFKMLHRNRVMHWADVFPFQIYRKTRAINWHHIYIWGKPKLLKLMTHSRFAFCLKYNLNDFEHTWNTQLLQAIC